MNWSTRGSWMLPAMVLAGCACLAQVVHAADGASASAPPPIAFEISYLPATVNAANGIVVVRPPDGRLLIGTASGARVELRLPNEAPQVLNSFTFQPKAPADERYAFKVPATFVPPSLFAD